MSDTFVLCPKCGEEVISLETITNLKGEAIYCYCTNCKEYIEKDKVKIETTEYLKGEEDEKMV